MDRQRMCMLGIARVVLAAVLAFMCASPGAGLEVRSVESMLAEYQQSFPEIAFVLVRGPEDFGVIALLPDLLGDDAVNVDYEHDTHVRQLLMDAQLTRITRMAGNGWASATLFRTGSESAFTRPYACIITLNAAKFRNHATAASRFMAGAAGAGLQLRDQAVLDNETFIRFSVDHEAFHCLDAYLHGPTRRKTYDDMTASYQEFRAEYRADLYAGLALRNRHRHSTDFLEKMTRYRTLSVLDGEPRHNTAEALTRARSVPQQDLNALPLSELAHRSSRLAEAGLPSRARFIDLLAAVHRLAPEPMRGTLAANIKGLARLAVDPRLLDALARKVDRARRQTFVAPAPTLAEVR